VRNAREGRYFDYFRHCTLPDLSGYHTHSDFWNYVLLQTSQSSSAVLHATLALGALHEQMNTGMNLMPKNMNANRFPLEQVNKSIRSLCRQGSALPVQVALTCCVLFICIGNAEGNYEGALRHLHSGLSMLESWRLQEKGPTSNTEAQEIFVQIFCRLDMQATAFLDSRLPHLHATSFNDSTVYGPYMPQSFAVLQEAQVALDRITIRSFYSLISKLDTSTKETLLQGLEIRFSQWYKCFEALISQVNDSLQTKDLQLAVLLKLHHETMSLMLRIKLDHPLYHKSIISNPPIEAGFSNIISAARSLIKSSTPTSCSTFTAETGIIAPLYFTAMKSRRAGIRKEAIELLSSLKRREGFWDPEMAAKVAKTVSGFTEAGISDLRLAGSLPDLAKRYGDATT
jgi:hypothetical protein